MNPVVPQTEYRGLRLLLHKVHCIDETGSGMDEWGEDEIYMAAVAVDNNGQTSSNGLFHVRNFDDGEIKEYSPPKLLQHFNIREGGDSFPKIYSVSMALIEHDHGNLSKWFSDLLNAVSKKVQNYLLSVIGAVEGKPLGDLSAAIGWVLGQMIGWVKSWLEDDHLGNHVVQATINSYSGNWTSTGTALTPIRTRDHKGDSSHYRVFYQWQLVP